MSEGYRARLSASTALLLALATPVAPASAQTGPAEDRSGGLDDIVVTARRVAENIQRTPISIAAFSAADIARRDIVNVNDLSSQVANFSIISGQGGGTTQSQISIRGVGQSDFILTSDQSVGLYVDGVYFARSLGAALDLVDTQRIEVLRGPQGTLFGRNTTAGAVQIISTKPDDSFAGSLEAKYGRFEHIDVKAMLNVPLSDKAFLRVSGATLNEDGYGHRLFQGTTGADTEVLAARGALRLLPAEGLTIDIAVDASRKRGNGGLERTVRIDPTDPNLAFYNSFLVAQGLPPADERYITANVHDSWAGSRNRDDNDIFGVSGTVALDVGGATIKSISAYRRLKAHSGYDFDGTPYPLAEQALNLSQHQLSQELQATGKSFGDRLTWVAGAFYFYERAADLEDVPFYEPVVATGAGGFTRIGGGYSFTSYIAQKTHSYAGYAQGSFHVTDALSLTAGLRYTHEKKRLYSSLTGAFVRAPGAVEASYHDLSPHFGLEYQIDRDTMAYASVSRGFRSGGFNGRNTTPVPPQSYKPEKIWAYEVGGKTEFLDHRLRLNGAVFYYDYRDFQGLTLDSFSGITVTVGNIASVKLYGFEADLAARPTRDLTLSLGVGYTHQNIDKVAPGAQITIRPDTRLVNSPEWTANASVDYEHPLNDRISLIAHADYGWKSAIEFFLPNYPDERQRGYGIGNLRIGVRLARPSLELEGYVTNVGNVNYRVFAENGTALGVPTTTAIYGRPREYGMRARWRF